jgi:hypothetical protein
MQDLLNPPALIARALSTAIPGTANEATPLEEEAARAFQMLMDSNARAKPGQWLGQLAHRGQPPARGVITGPAKLVGSKGNSRRDNHRMRVALRQARTRTQADHSAQIAAEAKAERSRKARATYR